MSFWLFLIFIDRQQFFYKSQSEKSQKMLMSIHWGHECTFVFDFLSTDSWIFYIIGCFLSGMLAVATIATPAIKRKIMKKENIRGTEIVQGVGSGKQDGNIQLPFNHPSGISSLFAIDAGHFAVGYYDGYIYVRWNGGEYHARLFGRPATAIKFCEYNKKLYLCALCALDGQVKILETTTLTPENRIFYRKGYSFVNMHISSTQQQPCILNLLTLEGRQLLLKPNMEPIFQRPMEKNPLMTSIENNKTVTF